MIFETLSRGNSLHRQIIDTENDIRKLQEWIEELKKDPVVMICSYDNPKEKFIVERIGTEVLHLVKRRLNVMKEILKDLKDEFDSL